MINKWIYGIRKTNVQALSTKPNLILGMHNDLFTLHKNPNLCLQRLKRPHNSLSVTKLHPSGVSDSPGTKELPQCRNVRTTPNSSWPNFALAIPTINWWCCVFIKWNSKKILLCRHVTRLDSGSRFLYE